MNTSPAEQLAISQKRIELLFEETSIDSGNQHRANAASALQKAESLLTNITGEDGADLINLIENVRDNLQSADMNVLENAVTELTELMYFLELAPA